MSAYRPTIILPQCNEYLNVPLYYFLQPCTITIKSTLYTTEYIFCVTYYLKCLYVSHIEGALRYPPKIFLLKLGDSYCLKGATMSLFTALW